MIRTAGVRAEKREMQSVTHAGVMLDSSGLSRVLIRVGCDACRLIHTASLTH